VCRRQRAKGGVGEWGGSECMMILESRCLGCVGLGVAATEPQCLACKGGSQSLHVTATRIRLGRSGWMD